MIYINFLYLDPASVEPSPTPLSDAGWALEDRAIVPSVGDVVILAVGRRFNDVKLVKVVERTFASPQGESAAPSQDIWLTVTDAEGSTELFYPNLSEN
ncbi:MAG: hypothetical protein M3315_05745 [Actinomycetota bacterium]|nr:hypothetical protein [Actinomycetota bacterium]